MEETFAEFLKLNESKNIMAVAGTPLTLAGLWVMMYQVSCLIQIQIQIQIKVQIQIHIQIQMQI